MSKHNIMLFWGLTLALWSGSSLAATDTDAAAATATTTTQAASAFAASAATAAATNTSAASASTAAPLSVAPLSAKEILADPLFKANKELHTLQQQCLAQDQVSCLTLAMFFEGQEKIPQGQYWYEQACNLHNAAACNRLATQLAHGIGPFPPEPTRALKFHRQACELNHEQACISAGLAYYQGLGVESDLSQALELFIKASKLQSSHGALLAGVFYQKGLGIPADPAQALNYFKQACALQNGEGCFEAAHLYAGDINEPKTPLETKIAINEGFREVTNSDSNAAATANADTNDNSTTAPDSAPAITPIAPAAPTKPALSAEPVASAESIAAAVPAEPAVPKDFAAATAFLEKGCELNHGNSCFALGQQYLHGLGKKQDTAQAKQLFNKACTLESAKACAYAATLKEQN